jgi:histidinol-phosphatase
MKCISSMDAPRAILRDVDDLDLALRMADVADEITQTAFAAKAFATYVKEDGTPVTDVDVAVEEELVRLRVRHRPDDAVLSEELGARGRSHRTWIIDGIDGTASFARGGTGWGTLIALRVEHDVAVGVATSPGLGRRWWAARGSGAWTAPLSPTSSRTQPHPLSVSRTGTDKPRWSIHPTSERLDGWRRQLASTHTATATGSGQDPLNVAEGLLDGVVVLHGGPWDHAPFVVLVEEAGGRFSDLWGGRRLDTRTAIYSNGDIHDDLRARAGTIAPGTTESHYEHR